MGKAALWGVGSVQAITDGLLVALTAENRGTEAVSRGLCAGDPPSPVFGVR